MNQLVYVHYGVISGVDGDADWKVYVCFHVGVAEHGSEAQDPHHPRRRHQRRQPSAGNVVSQSDGRGAHQVGEI